MSGGRSVCTRLNFYPRPPRGGRPEDGGSVGSHSLISIHALREEGDYEPRVQLSDSDLFLSTPSARRATRPARAAREVIAYFYPRPPRGGRRYAAGYDWEGLYISIHALREEGDQSHLRPMGL